MQKIMQLVSFDICLLKIKIKSKINDQVGSACTNYTISTQKLIIQAK